MSSARAKLGRHHRNSLKKRLVFCPRSGAWVPFGKTLVEHDSGLRMKKGYEDPPGLSLYAIDVKFSEIKPVVNVEVSTAAPTSFDMGADEITVWGL